jgi:hypothetical protein
MEEIDIEYGMPTTDVAMPLLRERLKAARQRGAKTVKIIHGYGSSGKGGGLRKATLALLDRMQKSQAIKAYVDGERWSKFDFNTLRLIDRHPTLYGDPDLERYNRGITVVFL